MEFYSKSFDKYKILEKILFNQKQNLIKNKNKIKKLDQIIKIEENKDIKESLLEKGNNSKKENNKITDEYSINNDKKDEIKNDSFDLKNKYEDKNYLPKRNIIDFICNTFYSEKFCCKCEKQKIIYACKNIVLKYYSIENVLHNQIMLENLLEDYKWNNPNLKNILNNNSESFQALKKLLVK